MSTLKLIALGTYGIIFLGFTLIVGRVLRNRGLVFLTNTFRGRPAIAESAHFLLALGFYLLCASLLLWNVGVEPTGTWEGSGETYQLMDLVQTIAGRLGISIFVVAAFHSLNLLVLSILNRTDHDPDHA